MDRLDCNTHQLIFSELATTLANQASRGAAFNHHGAFLTAPTLEHHKHRLSLADICTFVGLCDFCGALASSRGETSLPDVQPVLSYLRELLVALPDVHIEESMAWRGWPPPDHLTHSLILTLLRVACIVESQRATCVGAVISFTRKLVSKLVEPSVTDAHTVATRLVPCMHGMYRAMVDTTLNWSFEEFLALSKAFEPIGYSSQVLHNLNSVLVVLPVQGTAFNQVMRSTRRCSKKQENSSESSTLLSDSDEESLEYEEATFQDQPDDAAYEFRFGLLESYIRCHRPLSGQFVLCASIEILNNILSQLLAKQISSKVGTTMSELRTFQSRRQPSEFCTATQCSWNLLMSAPLEHVERVTVAEGLNVALTLASRTYHGMYHFVCKEQIKCPGKTSPELYALELLSETLKLSVLCSVGQTCSDMSRPNVNAEVFARVLSLLSRQANIYEPVLQGAALQSSAVLVMNYSNLVMPMTSQLRRFVTTPLTMFEPFPSQEEGAKPPILMAAAKALGACVTVHDDDGLVVSSVYTLLNYLGRDAGLASSNGTMASSFQRHTTRDERMTEHTDEQKVSIIANTLAVVAHLATNVVGTMKIISLTLSMLLQRLRAADGTSESLIMINIVPVAVSATQNLFIEVVRAFINVLRSTMGGGVQRRDSTMAHVAMFQLAQNLKQPRRVFVNAQEKAPLTNGNADEASSAASKELFLVELLQLFNEKGKQIQKAVSGKRASLEELGELRLELARLLPTIAVLLRYDDVNPSSAPTMETVSLFRNMWFFITLFNLANPEMARRTALEAARSRTYLNLTSLSVMKPAMFMHKALALIALNTPTLVPESAHNYIESELEYNSVLKHAKATTYIDRQRKDLAQTIPSQASTVRSFKLPQIVFLLTIFNVEVIRSSLRRPSMLLWYFANDGINKSSLAGPMDAIAEKVIQEFIMDIRPQMADHTVEPLVKEEIRTLFQGSIHRAVKVRQRSGEFLDKLFGAYPTLLCDPKLVVFLLEMLTLLRRACEAEFTDEFSPVYHYTSTKANIALDLGDDYAQRREILYNFLRRSQNFLQAALCLAPVEIKSILQSYLSELDYSASSYTDLGKSVAAELARSASVGNRREAFLPALGGWSADASSTLFADITAKSHHTGEMLGIQLAFTRYLDEIKGDPQAAFLGAAVTAIKSQVSALEQANMPPDATEVRRLLHRAAALIVALPKVRGDIQSRHLVKS